MTADKPFDVVERFREILDDNDSQDIRGAVLPIMTIMSLRDCIAATSSNTISELMTILEINSQTLKSKIQPIYSIQAGTELYQAFVVRTMSQLPHAPDFTATKAALLQRTDKFIEASGKSREKLSHLGCNFIRDDMTILITGSSRCVTELLTYAVKQMKYQIRVYISQSRPFSYAGKIARKLQNAGIQTCIILDSAMGVAIQKCDLVLVGAEVVCENGGVIGGVGTYQASLLSKANHVPFYICCEACKFARYTPLSQSDVPQPSTFSFETLDHEHSKLLLSSSDEIDNDELDQLVEKSNPKCDYTPAEYITALITDIGVIPPSGVSEELLRRFL